MKKLNVLVVSLGIVGAMSAAEQDSQPSLSKSKSAPLVRQGGQTNMLMRTTSVRVGAHGAVVGNVPLAPAPSVVSLNENVPPLQPVPSQGYQGDDSDSDVATQILSSGEASGAEGDDESFGTPTAVNSEVQFPLSDSANATGNVLVTKK